ALNECAEREEEGGGGGSHVLIVPSERGLVSRRHASRTFRRMPTITFEPLHEGVEPPRRATAASAGHDLAACLAGGTVRVFTGNAGLPRAVHQEDGVPAITLAPGEKALIPLGFKARLPEGYEAQVRPRSGTSLKTDLVIVNSPGTIDADFPDEWCVPVRNGGPTPLTI